MHKIVYYIFSFFFSNLTNILENYMIDSIIYYILYNTYNNHFLFFFLTDELLAKF